MGLFQQRPEERRDGFALPSEPLTPGAAELLQTAPPVLPLSIDSDDRVTSLVVPLPDALPLTIIEIPADRLGSEPVGDADD